MNFVKLSLTNDRFYRKEAYSDYAYGVVSFFLTDEIDADAHSFIDWFFKPETPYFSGNMVLVEKLKHNRVRLYYSELMQFSDSLRRQLLDATGLKKLQEDITMSQEDLRELLLAWDRCRNMKSPEIWIKSDGRTFWVEGVR